MNLTVTIREVYGNRTVYPHCGTSHKLARLIGTKTFTGRAIEQLKDLGYTFNVLGETL